MRVYRNILLSGDRTVVTEYREDTFMPEIETYHGTLKKEYAYFAASNSYKGFVSYFDQIFRGKNITHLYIIKGGPGTGKSRFMREIASSAEAYGDLVEYYYCSSDQSSLDGIIIYHTTENSEPSAIAFADGTAPHSLDTVLPGAREDIIDLGQFWNNDILSDYADEIARLGRSKGEHYTQAYRYLYASHAIKCATNEILKPFMLFENIEKYADEIANDIPKKEARISPALIDSIGTLGEIRYDSFSPFASKTIYIDDIFGCAPFMLGEIFDRLRSKGADIKVSYDPIEPDEINALFINNGELAVIKCDRDMNSESAGAIENTVSTRSFLSSPLPKLERQKLRHLFEMRRSLITLAVSEFELAGKIHFEIEGTYIAAMDFTSKEIFSRKFREKLF